MTAHISDNEQTTLGEYNDHVNSICFSFRKTSALGMKVLSEARANGISMGEQILRVLEQWTE